MNYLDFMPLAHNRAGQLGALNGVPYAQWATSEFMDYWGDPNNWGPGIQPETYGVENCGGEQWLTLPALGPHQIQTVKAVLQKQGQSPKEILCKVGHPYALLNFVPHSIEVWGLVGGLQFYWKAWYRRMAYTNPLLGITKECIEQSEVWGNANPPSPIWQWVRGGPQPPTAVPFSGNTPVPIVTESAWFQGLGKGYGPGWVMGEIKDGGRIITSCANSEGWSW